MQRPDKNTFDVLDEIASFMKQLSLWKEDIANVSGSSQCFTFLYNLLVKKYMMLPSNLGSIFLQHPSKFESKFSSVLSAEFIKFVRIHHPFVQAAPSSFAEREKEDYIDLTCYKSVKRKIYSGNPTNFWLSLNDEHPALAKNTPRVVIHFVASYLCEAGFSATAMIKTKYRSRISVKREMRVGWQFHKFFQDSTNVVKIGKPMHHAKSVVLNRVERLPRGCQ